MSKEEILKAAIQDWKEVEINGIYIIPTEEEYDNNGFACIQLIGYAWETIYTEDGSEDKIKRYYDLGDIHDVVNLNLEGGLSIDVEIDNGLTRLFWNDRRPRKVNNDEAFLFSIFMIDDDLAARRSI